MSALNPFMLCLPSPVAGEYSRAKLKNKRGKDPRNQGFKRGGMPEQTVTGVYHDHLRGLTVLQIAARWELGYYSVHRIVNKNSYVWHTDVIDLELEMLKQQQEAENDAQQQGL